VLNWVYQFTDDPVPAPHHGGGLTFDPVGAPLGGGSGSIVNAPAVIQPSTSGNPAHRLADLLFTGAGSQPDGLHQIPDLPAQPLDPNALDAVFARL
jgi:hypothetical protein